jgi:hypothetical protein
VLDVGAVLALPDNIEVQISSLQRLPGEVRRVGRLCREKRIDAVPLATPVKVLPH